MSTSDSEVRSRRKKRAKKREKRRPRIAPPLHPVETPSSWKTKPVAIALVLGLLGGGAGGFYAGQQYRPARARRPDPGPAYVELAAWSPRKGPQHAKVTIVEFSDFQ